MSDAHRAEIAKLETLYAEHPEGRIFTHLAEACRKAGDHQRAREVLSEGLDRHPDYPSAHVVLGRVLLDEGEREAARSEFRRVLELDAQNLIALRSLGDISRAEGRTEDALEYYRELLELEPSDPAVREAVEALESAEAGPSVEAMGEAHEALAEERTGAGTGQDVAEAEDPVEAEAAAGSVVPGSEPAGIEEEPAAVEEAPESGAPEEERAAEEEPAPVDVTAEAAWDEAAWTLSDESDVEPARTDEAEAEGVGAGEDVDEQEAVAGPAEFGDTAGVAEEAVVDAGAVDAEDLEGPGGSPDLTVSAGEQGSEEEIEVAEDADVMTETIAQVYARQGLYDRAAEVYRELVRMRPEDEALRERLAEMEEKAGPDGAAPGVEEVAPGPGELALAAEEPDLEAEMPGLEAEELDLEAEEGELVADGASLEVEEDGREPDAPDPEAEDAGFGFEAPDLEPDEPEPSELAMETPSDLEADAEPLEGLQSTDFDTVDPDIEPLPGLETQEVDPETGLTRDDEPVAEPVEPEIEAGELASFEVADPVGGTDEAEEAYGEEPEKSEEPSQEDADWEVISEELWTLQGEPWHAEDEEPEEVEAPEEPEAPESPWTDGPPTPGGAETPYAWTESEEPEPDASPPIGNYLSTLLGWGGGTAGAGMEEGAAAPEPGGGSEPGSEAGAEPGDDDDLEMFRSWLESLKQ